MGDLLNFNEYNEQIFNACDLFEIKHLSQVEFGGKNSSSFFSDILTKKHNINKLPYSLFKIHDELDFITKDIRYIVGTIVILRPHIIDVEVTGGKYFQSLEDRRYIMYSNFGFQSIYIFWDRIGDLLFLYLKTGIDEKKVVTSIVLNNIQPEYKKTDQYIALKKFYDENIKFFIEDRNQIVHYYQLDSKFYWGHIEFADDPTKRFELNKEKLELADRLQEMLKFCIKGFELALALIEILPNRTFFVFELDKSEKVIKSINEVRGLYNIVDQLQNYQYESDDKLKNQIQSLIDIPLELINVLRKPQS